MKITQSKQQNIKQTDKNEESLRDHSIIGVPRRRDKRDGNVFMKL